MFNFFPPLYLFTFFFYICICQSWFTTSFRDPFIHLAPSFPCETNTDIEYTYFDFNGSCRHEKDSAKRELIVIELHERSSCRVENRRRDGSRRWDVILYNSIAEIGHENHHRKFFTAIGVTCSVRGKYPTKYVVMLWINFFHSGRREGKKTRARIFSYNFSYNFQAGKINRRSFIVVFVQTKWPRSPHSRYALCANFISNSLLRS